jgi:hypothetical protein
MERYGTQVPMLLLRGMLCSAGYLGFKTLIILGLSTIRDLPDMTGKTSNAKGTLLLGYPEDGSDDEHLSIGSYWSPFISYISGDSNPMRAYTLEHLLASNVDLSKGLMTIKCPKVEPRNNYVVREFILSYKWDPSPCLTNSFSAQ